MPGTLTTRGRRRHPIVLVLVLAMALAGACTTDDAGTGVDVPTSGTTPPLTGTITVSAAASLQVPFTQIADDFRALHPGTEVRYTFDSSSTLAAQVEGGAPADVFAAADDAAMRPLLDRGVVAGAEVFTRNELVIVTKPGNPQGVTGLADLARPGVGVVALCAESAPCGRYAAQALGKAAVTIPEGSVTRAPNARATVTAVASGDAAAAVVYATDARGVGDAVATVAIPAEQDVTASYPIGLVARSADNRTARAFVAYVTSDRGQVVLQQHGFLPVR